MNIKRTALVLLVLGSLVSTETKSGWGEFFATVVIFGGGSYVYSKFKSPQANELHKNTVEIKDSETISEEVNSTITTTSTEKLNEMKNTVNNSQNNNTSEFSSQENNKSETNFSVITQEKKFDENLVTNNNNNLVPEENKISFLSSHFKTIFAGISGVVALSVLGKIAFNEYKQYREKQKAEQENADQEYNEIEQLLS
jgi:hypothetical protein